ncbi:MAG TPA: hypothetical protein VMP68_01845 [Candidatus Eisenbacteria bacterium]|nr:hypothetical protein [Candidatus Eisenbacteria bacterium]
MEGREIEPRKTVWAVAEVSWQEPDGTPACAPATLEDTSNSGACVRVKRPFAIGSRVMIKWRREQFSAIARNCRRDGRDFLLGVHREGTSAQDGLQPEPRATAEAKTPGIAELVKANLTPVAVVTSAKTANVHGYQARVGRIELKSPARPRVSGLEHQTRLPMQVAKSPPVRLASAAHDRDMRSDSERKVMQPKSFIPQFWRRQQDGNAPAKNTSTEAIVNKTTNLSAEPAVTARAELLSYEDIYRAAGILAPGAGYDIHKVVDMLNSERIRDLSKDVKRASVLMALDAAGIAVNDLLTDATRRQNALNSYEAAQRKQLEDFEAQKAQENSRIEQEIERIRVHYAERIQKNLDLVAREKESLRNWQGAMQHESQRIAEVIELCGKPAAAPPNAMAAAATQGSANKPSGSAESLHSVSTNPSAKG